MNDRELRLRSRIDQLLDRIETARNDRAAAEAKLDRERAQNAYLNRRVNALLRQREFWKRRASVIHEVSLLAQRRRYKHGR